MDKEEFDRLSKGAKRGPTLRMHRFIHIKPDSVPLVRNALHFCIKTASDPVTKKHLQEVLDQLK